jgi:hypothetical protein
MSPVWHFGMFPTCNFDPFKGFLVKRMAHNSQNCKKENQKKKIAIFL